MEANDYLIKGNSKYDLRDYSGAIEDYTKALELDPNESTLYNKRGDAKANLKDYSGAIEDYTKALELDPNDSTLYNKRGDAKANLKDYSGAIEDYTKAINLDPKYAIAYGNRGFAKYHLKEDSGAIEDYTKAIELDPKNAFAYNSRGVAKFNKEDYWGAIEDCTKLIELDSMSFRAYYIRGYAKYNLDDYQGTIQDFTKFIELEKNNIEALFKKLFEKRNQKHYQQKYVSFDYYYNEKLQKRKKFYYSGFEDNVEKDFRHVFYIESYLYRGNAKYCLNDYSGALDDFTLGLELSFNDEHCHSNYLTILLNTREKHYYYYEDSVVYYTTEIHNNPNSTYAYLNRGLSYYFLGDFESALSDFKIVEVTEFNSMILFYFIYAQIKYKLNDYEGAFNEAKKAIRIYGIKRYWLNRCFLIMQFNVLRNLLVTFNASVSYKHASLVKVNNIVLYSKTCYLDFGKYKGIKLEKILKIKPAYLEWCVINVNHFLISEELFEDILIKSANNEILKNAYLEKKQLFQSQELYFITQSELDEIYHEEEMERMKEDYLQSQYEDDFYDAFEMRNDGSMQSWEIYERFGL